MALIMNPQTESDYDPPKPPSEQSTPELLNIMLTVKSRAASNHPDRDEDLAAVLCHRSSTGRVNQLSRVSLLQDCIDMDWVIGGFPHLIPQVFHSHREIVIYITIVV